MKATKTIESVLVIENIEELKGNELKYITRELLQSEKIPVGKELKIHIKITCQDIPSEGVIH